MITEHIYLAIEFAELHNGFCLFTRASFRSSTETPNYTIELQCAPRPHWPCSAKALFISFYRVPGNCCQFASVVTCICPFSRVCYNYTSGLLQLMDSFEVSNNHVSYHRTPRGGFRGLLHIEREKRSFEIDASR